MKCWQDYFEWEEQDYNETVEGAREGYAEVMAGHGQPAEEALEELRVKYGFPRRTEC
jgi:hypothetical protein